MLLAVFRLPRSQLVVMQTQQRQMHSRLNA
jgi:hypothetical protein